MLPVNVFGLRFSTNHTEEGNTANYVLTLDAEHFSEVRVPDGYELFLELEVEGARAGFRVFANNEPSLDVRESGGVSTGVVYMPRGFGIPSQEAGGNHLRFGPPNSPAMLAGDTYAFFMIGNGLTVSPAAATAAINAAFANISGSNDPVDLERTYTSANPPVLISAGNNAPNLAEAVLDNARGESIWSNEFTVSDRERRRMRGDRGTNASTFNPTATPGNETVPLEHWRTITVPLNDIVIGGATPHMRGEIDIRLPIAAPEGGTITARLRLLSNRNVMSTVHNFGSFDISEFRGRGYTIESRGVAPMTNIARLNPIRITERGVGAFTNGNNNGNPTGDGAGHNIVRLVAPRGFRWDDGTMMGLLHNVNEFTNNYLRVHLSGSPLHWGPNNWRPGAAFDAINHPAPGTDNYMTDRHNGPVLGTWLNPITDRHEIYIHLWTPAHTVSTIQSRNTVAWVDINNLVMFPVDGAQQSGDVAIDVFIGTSNGSVLNQWWPLGAAYPDGTAGNVGWPNDLRLGSFNNNAATSAAATARAAALVTTGNNRLFLMGTTLPDGRVRQTRFGWFGENDAPGSVAPSGIPGWRMSEVSEMGLVVANLDIEGGITVTGPASPANVLSGRATAALNHVGNDRFMNSSNHTIRLRENATRTLFSAFDRYELRVTNDAVSIVDAEIRVGDEDNNSLAGNLGFDWTPVQVGANAAGSENTNRYLVPAATIFDGNTLQFAPRTLENNEDGVLRHMDIRLMLSVEAGYAAAFGNDIEVDVYRNNELLGTVVVANVTDPIRVERSTPATEMIRHQFDVIPLTPVGDITVVETEAGFFSTNDEIWLHVQATQNGRPVSIPQGMLSLFIGDFELNDTNLTIEPLRQGVGFMPRAFNNDISSQAGFRVIRPSINDAARITFTELAVAGPTIPGLEWHVIVSGAERLYENVAPGATSNNDTRLWLNDLNNNLAVAGLTPNSHRFFPSRIDTDDGDEVEPGRSRLGVYQERARMFGIGYHATVLIVRGDSHIDDGRIEIPGMIGRQSFTVNTMVDVDGAMIQAVAFPEVAPGIVSSMMNPRVFANFVGADREWNEAARSFTFTGTSAQGSPVTVVLTLDSPSATVNGVTVDIAEYSMQPQLRGNITPRIINNRQYVPARFLANAFGIPIEFAAGTVTLG